MARAIAMAGLLLAVTAGTARALEDEVVELAERAEVDPVDLQGAVYTTGLDALEYLYMAGHLARPAPKPAQVSYGIWDRLAQCEAGGNWHINAYHDGGLQFHPSTWSAYKPAGYPAFAYQASREQQIVVGQRVLASQGWRAWPTCSRIIGAR